MTFRFPSPARTIAGLSRAPFLALGLGLVLGLVLVGCSSAGASPSPAGSPASSLVPPASAAPTPPSASVGPTGASSGDATGACPTAAPPPLPAGETRTVTVETSKGTIVLKIDGSLAPNAAGNFVALAACGFYEGVVFHRLVPDFVIQGGDPTGTGTGGPGYTIEDQEVKGEYTRGTLAMARTSAPNSQGSQFFIVLTDDPAGAILESYRTYAIFGEVTEGMDVVDAIAAMPNSGDESGNQAIEPVAMTNLTVSTP
jgi:cyclophilin family peptidyl-prolyl cis-trans isomerase